jgi:protein-S-isoprenylcysteine O-methyltransferase Ste14
MGVWVRSLVFLVVVPGTVAVYVPLRWARPATTASLALGVPMMAAAALIVLLSFWDFAVLGRGTPAPIDPPRLLVTQRLYRRCRNPMYVGVVGGVLGEAVAFRSPPIAAYAVAVWLLFHAFVRLYEEPVLRRTFGPTYDDYRARVPRWIPRLSGRASRSASPGSGT